jgi:YesN/AraC family two-component response regulator
VTALEGYAKQASVTRARFHEVLFTCCSVNEICYRLGCKAPVYFSRCFICNAGMTPGDYRLRKSDSKEQVRW